MSAIEAARLGLFVAEAVSRGARPVLRYQFSTGVTVSSLEEAVRLLAKMPKPVACAPKLENDTLVLGCLALTDEHAKSAHRQAQEMLINHWREALGVGALPDAADILIRFEDGPRSLIVALLDWELFLLDYGMMFSAGHSGSSSSRPSDVIATISIHGPGTVQMLMDHR